MNEDYLKNREKDTPIDIEIRPIAVEMDEMWSYYHDKSHQVAVIGTFINIFFFGRNFDPSTII